MPPQQSCCCQDGVEPCPNCWEQAVFGCSPPCCWCDELEGLCEDDPQYAIALAACQTDWDNLSPAQSPCADTFNVNVEIPDEIEVRIGIPRSGPDPNTPYYNPYEKLFLSANTTPPLPTETDFFQTVNCTDVVWLTNATSFIFQRGDGIAPLALPDSSHVGRACTATNASACVSDTNESCSGNSGFCCVCGEESEDSCSYNSPYQSGFFTKDSHYETQTTTVWNKQVQDVDVTVSLDTRDNGNSPCGYYGIADEVVATGQVVYLGLRDIIYSPQNGWADPNCPSPDCNCDDDECENCLHCQVGNASCLNCQDKFCLDPDPYISWSGIENTANFDTYTVPINWKLEYTLSAKKFDSVISGQEFHWVQEVVLVMEEDWTGITVDPATQVLQLATRPVDGFPKYGFSAVTESDLAMDCYGCTDPDTPLCTDCSCSGCRLQEKFGWDHPLRPLARNLSDLDRCDYAGIVGGFSGGGVCTSLNECPGDSVGEKLWHRGPLRFRNFRLKADSGTVDWNIIWNYYIQDNFCTKNTGGKSTVWFDLLDYARLLQSDPDKWHFAVKVNNRINNCDNSCPKCVSDGGTIDCNWEDSGFAVEITGLGS